MHGEKEEKKKKGKHVFLVLMALQIFLILRLCEFNFLFREVSVSPPEQGARCMAVTACGTLAGAEGAATARGDK